MPSGVGLGPFLGSGSFIHRASRSYYLFFNYLSLLFVYVSRLTVSGRKLWTSGRRRNILRENASSNARYPRLAGYAIHAAPARSIWISRSLLTVTHFLGRTAAKSWVSPKTPVPRLLLHPGHLAYLARHQQATRASSSRRPSRLVSCVPGGRWFDGDGSCRRADEK